MTGTGAPKRTAYVPEISMGANCKPCEGLANRLRTAYAELQRLAQRANDLQMASDFEDFEEQRMNVMQLAAQLDECNKKCTTATTTTTGTIGDPTTTGNTPPTTTGATPPTTTGTTPTTTTGTAPTTTTGTTPTTTTGCFGDTCAAEWSACGDACTPIDNDCGVPGTCTAGGQPFGYAPPVGMTLTVNLADPNVWGNTLTITIELRGQTKGTGVFAPTDFPGLTVPMNATSTEPVVEIPPAVQQDVRKWFNPLGLIARHLRDQVDRWRGSMGPRPLIRPRDLELVEAYSSGEQLGLPKGLHVLLTDRGGSTGKTLGMQILNLTGKPVRLAARPFAIEPIRQQAQQQIQQAFNRLAKAAPVRLDLSAYCLEFLKAPPTPNTLMRLAPPAVQKKFEPMSKLLRSAYRLEKAGLLRPDSNPTAYNDSIKQWALWAVEQKLNESRFTEAFLGHTKKNVEGAGQKWSKPAEDMIRKVSPNRWRDILQVLRGAGVPVPQ